MSSVHPWTTQKKLVECTVFLISVVVLFFPSSIGDYWHRIIVGNNHMDS